MSYCKRKLSKTQLDKLNTPTKNFGKYISPTKNAKKLVLRISQNMTGVANNETNFPQKLVLTKN